MPTVITGTDGINQVQAGAVESGDLPAGSVVQIKNIVFTDLLSTTSTSFVDVTGFNLSITPLSTSSKILVSVNTVLSVDGDNNAFVQLLRDGTAIGNNNNLTNPAYGMVNANSTAFLYSAVQLSMDVLDTPSSLSSVNYKVQFRADGSSFPAFVNRRANDSTRGGTSTITLMEIAG